MSAGKADLNSAQSDFVLVPRIPTKEMLEAGWYEAHDEDAAGVWREMIRVWELQEKDRAIEPGI